MKDVMGLMKQAQAMQARLGEVQNELDRVDVEGQAGAGLVRVTVSAKGQVRGIAIDPSLMKEDEREILEDLLVAACEDARKKAQAVAEEKMKAVTAGLPLPPGFKLPF